MPSMSAALPLAAQLDSQRRQIFKVMSIIEACRLGTDSRLVPISGGDEPDLAGALVAAHELLDGVAETLERLSKESDQS